VTVSIDTLGAEADRLSAIVEAHAETLRSGSLGKNFELEGRTFRLFARGRNMVYQVADRHRWFLKVLRRPNANVIDRERTGARVIRAALGNHPQYVGSEVIRVADAPAYVLSSQVPGRPMNKIITVDAWLPQRAAALDAAFLRLGEVLATLHTNATLTPGAPTATTQPFAHLQQLLDSNPADAMTDALQRWYEQHHHADDGTGFIHGNFRFDNILSSASQVAFLDFENSGAGSPYQDLSRPVTDLLLTSLLVVYPYVHSQRWTLAFLEGYARIRPYDPEVLWDFVCARLARYYFESRGKSFWELSVRGIPMVRSRLHSLMNDAITGGPVSGGRAFSLRS
jgi:Ser/Thr protein kinase RdoA (MazF antagonist)